MADRCAHKTAAGVSAWRALDPRCPDRQICDLCGTRQSVLTWRKPGGGRRAFGWLVFVAFMLAAAYIVGGLVNG